jgi:DnaA N-terminal domain
MKDLSNFFNKPYRTYRFPCCSSNDENEILSDILAWKKNKEGWIYKSDKDLARETLLTERQVKYLKKKLTNQNILKTGKRSPHKYKSATPYDLGDAFYAMISEAEKATDKNAPSAPYDFVCSDGQNRPVHIIEAENTTEEYNRERRSDASSDLTRSPSFLDRFYSEWENCTGKVERQARIAKWFNSASDGDKELAISNVARYAKAIKELERSSKHPYFFLEDREFSKDYVVDTPLALTENRKAQSIILTNNHPPEIQKQLIEELGEPVYKSWFEQCNIVQSGCDIEVTAPNNFVKETVEELLGKSRFGRSYDSIKVMIAEFACVLLEYLEPIEQYYYV